VALPDDGTLSAGATFLVIFGSLFAAYLFGGMAIMKFVKGAQGVEIIPNYGFWSSLPSLVKVQTTRLLLQF
jgi:cation-dependent mannose-6-phosphate receptor